jgi:SAM-dependent methyltransferase
MEIEQPGFFSFPRYLLAKKPVDDRALNKDVWKALQDALACPEQPGPVRILEIGCGIGTMLHRLLQWELSPRVDYTGIDEQQENIQVALASLPGWLRPEGWRVVAQPAGLRAGRGGSQVDAAFEAVDLFKFLPRVEPGQTWDLVIAHAFLDLIDVPAVLPRLIKLLRPGGLAYFTINFDGVTGFEPALDPELDRLVVDLYHRTMDERSIGNSKSGDSQAGRHLFRDLGQAGATILAAGSSDWVVYPRQRRYPGDEAYFLQFILHFVESSLGGHPDLSRDQLAGWLRRRREQIATGELVFIAHQLDFLAEAPGQSGTPKPI